VYRPIAGNEGPVGALHEGKTLLVTGAGGCIGSALAKRLATFQPRLIILLDHSEQNLHQIRLEFSNIAKFERHVCILGDILDGALVNELFESYSPDIIYHAAAFKHVPLMERNPIAVVRNNAIGTWHLAKAAVRYAAECFIMISTDKAVNPRSVMGAAKRVAELALLRLSVGKTPMSAVRFGNVLGSHGSVVPLFRQQIERGGPVTVTHPAASRYFLTLREAVDLILTVTSLSEGGVIFVPELGSPVKIVDLAERLIRETGMESAEQIKIVFTELRPGEKLTEELFSERESLEPTVDARLYKISGPQISGQTLDMLLHKLHDGVLQRNLAGMMETLCSIVPEYQPSETLLELLKPSPA